MRFFVLTLLLAALPASAAETGSALSPAQRRIEMAEKQLQKQPSRFQAENDLAMALMARARETADSSYYPQAESAIARSLQIQPHNFDGEQAHVALLLAEHRYAQALAEAKALNQRTPDSVSVWGYMAEADGALGNYDDAAKSAQWMLTLRPGNVPGLLRAAALREDWGDLDGAADLLHKALDEAPAFETEQTAWILTGLARLNRATGQLEAADFQLARALVSFPDYYASLEELSRVRMAQHREEEAVELLQKRNLHFPSPRSLDLLGAALDGAGRTQDAQAAFSSFEQAARERVGEPDNANRELVLYYAGRGHQPAEALRIARIEIDRRHDVGTLDAYAWALYCNGQYGEARQQIDKALAVGARDVDLFRHAAAISTALGDKDTADRELKQAFQLSPECSGAGCDPRVSAR
jgi:tetratricopeptide (TPR) repeat protein